MLISCMDPVGLAVKRPGLLPLPNTNALMRWWVVGWWVGVVSGVLLGWRNGEADAVGWWGVVHLAQLARWQA